MAKHMYGFKPQKQDTRDIMFHHLGTTRAILPSAYDIRTKLGVPIVFNQLQLSSCTANASALCYMYMLKKEGLPKFVPSRLFIYANSRMIENTPLTEDSGAALRDVMKAIQTRHVCTENTWPYIEKNVSVKPPMAAYTAALKHKEFKYLAVAQTKTAIKTALLNDHAIVFGLQLFPEFESETVAKTGIVPMPNPDEQSIGGHALTIRSFDDSKKCFGVQNSWGDKLHNSPWGIAGEGWCWIPYDYILNPDLACDFWIIQACN